MQKIIASCGLWAALVLVAAPGPVRAANSQPYGGKLNLTTIAATDPIGGSFHVLGTMEGNSPALGKFAGWVLYDVNLTTGEFEGQAIKVAANGDQAFETLTGQFTDATLSASVGEFAFNGGTGRFENATGSGTFTSVFESATEASVEFSGTLSYDAASRADGPLPEPGDYDVLGQVIFRNILASLGSGEPAPYTGVGASRLMGLNVQTGSIQPTSPLAPVAGVPGAFQFLGEVGPHPELGTRVHVISTSKGDLFCHWVATFTIQFINVEGDAIFSGDGIFTVLGGTGHYRNASGTFRTLFETQAIKAGADTAVADVTQEGTIAR